MYVLRWHHAPAKGFLRPSVPQAMQKFLYIKKKTPQGRLRKQLKERTPDPLDGFTWGNLEPITLPLPSSFSSPQSIFPRLSCLFLFLIHTYFSLYPRLSLLHISIIWKRPHQGPDVSVGWCADLFWKSISLSFSDSSILNLSSFMKSHSLQHMYCHINLFYTLQKAAEKVFKDRGVKKKRKLPKNPLFQARLPS